MSLLFPLMPSRLASKVILIGEAETKAKLSTYLLNGEDDIPTFLGGKADHDKFYPKDGAFPDKALNFDYNGMMERLVEEKTSLKLPDIQIYYQPLQIYAV